MFLHFFNLLRFLRWFFLRILIILHDGVRAVSVYILKRDNSRRYENWFPASPQMHFDIFMCSCSSFSNFLHLLSIDFSSIYDLRISDRPPASRDSGQVSDSRGQRGEDGHL